MFIYRECFIEKMAGASTLSENPIPMDATPWYEDRIRMRHLVIVLVVVVDFETERYVEMLYNR